MKQFNRSAQRAIIYVRVSSDEQVDGTSLDFQESQCRKYCSDEGMEVRAVFREEGGSAKTAQRKEFLKAIEFCRKSNKKKSAKLPIDAFVVHKCDRFARNVEDHMMVKRKLMDFGTRLHSVSEPIDDSAMGKMFETMMSAFAEFDNSIRTQRSIDGMSEKIKQGLWPWSAPCGYVSNQFRKKDQKKTQPDKIHPELFPILQKGFKQLAQGAYKTQAQLVQDLDDMGFAAVRGKKTYNQFVLKLLTEKRLKFYSGLLENPFDGKDYPGLHEPMISIEEATRIRFWLNQNRVQPTSKTVFNTDFPLRQIMQCDTCKNGLTGAYAKGRSKQYRYYWCKNKSCRQYSKSIKAERLEATFKILLTKITPIPAFWESFRKNVLQAWEGKKNLFLKQKEAYANKLKRLENRRDRLIDMYADGLLNSKEEFEKKRDAIENEILTLKISHSEINIETLDIEVLIEQAKIYAESIAELWRDLVHPEQRAKFMRFVFPEGISYDRKKDVLNQQIGYIFNVSKAFEESKDKNPQISPLVTLRGFPLNQIIEELLIFQEEAVAS